MLDFIKNCVCFIGVVVVFTVGLHLVNRLYQLAYVTQTCVVTRDSKLLHVAPAYNVQVESKGPEAQINIYEGGMFKRPKAFYLGKNFQIICK